LYYQSESTAYLAAINRAEKGMFTTIYKTTDTGKHWNPINKFDYMILNLELINCNLYGASRNIIIKNVDKADKADK